MQIRNTVKNKTASGKKSGKPFGKRRRRCGEHGIITVFVTLIMVPVVVITSIMVDLTRWRMYSSQAVMAADSYGDAVLSEYDNLLKELYGLFSVTQNEKGLEAVEKLAEYTQCSFDPNKIKLSTFMAVELSGFMPYAAADVQVSYEKVDGASLSNNNVLMTQINDFMKYRIVEEVLDKAGILNSLEQFGNMDNDMDAVEARNEITESSSAVLKNIAAYYKELNKLAAYPAYLDVREAAYLSYRNKLKDIVTSQDYADYVNYIKNKDEIDAAKAALDEYEKQQEEKSKSHTGESGTGGSEDEDDEDDDMDPETLADLIDLADQYVDVSAYKTKMQNDLAEVQNKARNNDSDPIDFDSAPDIKKKLGELATDVNDGMTELETQVNDLKAKLQSCSPELKDGIETEIAELEKIVETRPLYMEVYNYINEHNFDPHDYNSDNNEHMEDVVGSLDEAAGKVINCEDKEIPDINELAPSGPRSFIWYDFQEIGEYKEFYEEELKKLCESTGDGSESQEKQKEAEDAQKNAEDELKKDEETSARDISDELAAQMQINDTEKESEDKVPGFTDYFSGGLSLETVEGLGTYVVSKFMLSTYDFGMFSSRVSGQKPEGEESGTEPDEEAGGDGSSGEEEYVDYSLTKVAMSKDINYLYGAELEYLFGGHQESKRNLNEVRNIVCGIRTTMNFISSYTVSEVNEAITAISDAAAALSGPAAPLVKVAVSGALRLAFAAIETVADWKALTGREGAVFLKTDFDQLESLDTLEGLLGKLSKNKSGDTSEKGFELTYEDYLYILLVLFTPENTLLTRTSDLITLNVNQAENTSDTLTTLNFKMADTVTAVKSTCKVKADFVVLPDNFAELFLSAGGAKNAISYVEDNYFGYSVIRGY